MTTQPKALFLADVIESDPTSAAHHDEAADELRRLQALLEAEQALHQRVTYPELQRLRAQRDALLEALKWLDKWMSDKTIPECVWKVRAAIKAVEENT